MVVGTQLVAMGITWMVLGWEAITVVGALEGPTMIKDPVLDARSTVTVTRVVVVVRMLVMLSLAAAELEPGRVAVTVASSVVVKVSEIVVVRLVVVGTGAALDGLEAPAPIEEDAEAEDTGIGTIVSVIGVTEVLDTPAAAELEEDGLAAADEEEETMAAAEVVVVADEEDLPGQLVTSGAQEVMVISSTEV